MATKFCSRNTVLGCTKKTLLSPNFIKLGHYVWLGINKRHAKYLRKISIPNARACVFCILHVNAEFCVFCYWPNHSRYSVLLTKIVFYGLDNQGVGDKIFELACSWAKIFEGFVCPYLVICPYLGIRKTQISWPKNMLARKFCHLPPGY